MTSRIDQLPENRLMAQVQSLRADVNALKAAQRVGAANVQVFTNHTNAAYDSALTIGSFDTVGITVIFTAAVQQYAKATLSYRMFVDSPTSEMLPHFHAAPYYPTIRIYPQIITASQPYGTKWIITLLNNDASTRTFFLKFTIQSTDVGGIAVI